MLRSQNVSRQEAYTRAGFINNTKRKDIGHANATHLEKRQPNIIEYVTLNKHLSMLISIEEVDILDPKQRLYLLSDIAKGRSVGERTMRMKVAKTFKVGERLDGSDVNKVVLEDEVILVDDKPGVNQRMKAIDTLNKMDGTYDRPIIIRTEGTTADFKQMTSEQMLVEIASIDSSIQKLIKKKANKK